MKICVNKKSKAKLLKYELSLATKVPFCTEAQLCDSPI